ncbi:glycosyltransferase family 2 protein [Flavisolibacter ginsenosidimutans]|uniref:Glycosyltransferase family 2 protein n=1 Tax=Flavisolibacter ginsenosidimutans TaxID=661481 RepID=A0A5B8UL95_9BACT|nr:glycosyltransferase family 2 protein [Flavisolibacter ginsenosidimutans]QEC57328.1 glycosyltransferase family 2 protein [Flavisolibacter ginsenosidimutans]
MKKPLISVLIPTYNVEKFVKEAICSVLQQTYQNLEIVVVDDCSTDRTYELLEKLAAQDNRIKLFRNDKNAKIVASLNRALTHATGEFIARMDGDDVSAPDRLEKQYAFLAAHPEVDLVGVSYVLIDEEGKALQEEHCLTNAQKVKQATKFVSPIPHIWLAKRKVYDAVGSYRIPTAEDYDFILRALDKGFQATNLPDLLYFTRIRNGNTQTSAGLIQKKSFRYVQKLWRQRNLCNDGTDAYSDRDLEKHLRSGYLERACFSLATRFNQRFILLKNYNKWRALPWLFLAVAFSPKYLLREKYLRFRYKRLLT